MMMAKSGPFDAILSEEEAKATEEKLEAHRAALAEKQRAERRAEVAPFFDLYHSAGFAKTFEDILALPPALDGDPEIGTLVGALRQVSRLVQNSSGSYPSLRKDDNVAVPVPAAPAPQLPADNTAV
jgi:hypothetical protein